MSREWNLEEKTYGGGIGTEQLDRTLDEFIPRSYVNHGSASEAEERESLGTLASLTKLRKRDAKEAQIRSFLYVFGFWFLVFWFLVF